MWVIEFDASIIKKWLNYKNSLFVEIRRIGIDCLICKIYNYSIHCVTTYNSIEVEPDRAAQQASLGKLSVPGKRDTGSDSPGAGGQDEPVEILANMYGQLVTAPSQPCDGAGFESGVVLDY